MSNINQIAKGTLYNLLNKEEELYKERMKICRSCKMLLDHNIFGEICNPNLYINPLTDEISYDPKSGYIKGCHCVMGSKTRIKEASCIAGKW